MQSIVHQTLTGKPEAAGRVVTTRLAGPGFGAHMSVAGGAENAFLAGARVGCDCLQIFVKNQRQWRAPPLREEHVAAFRQAARDTGLAPVVAHATYLINLASPERETRQRSIRTMIDELERCERLGVSALIFHPGAHMDDSPSAGILRIASALNSILRSCQGYDTAILLETTAGQGTAIGHDFGQLRRILDRLRDPSRVGICLDTCHLFAAGNDFRTEAGYREMIERMDREFGVSLVKCIHVNDSKRECGSRVDRHEHIGKGRIGKRGFAHFVNDPRFHSTPFILETPKGVDGRGADFDKVNLKKLRKLLNVAVPFAGGLAGSDKCPRLD